MRSRAAIGGVLLLVLAWGVLLPSSLPPFSAHMTAHMIVVAVAAPLIAYGLVGTPLDLGARGASPIVASMVELVVVWVWHAPALHVAASEHAWTGVAEQGSFLAAGVFLWTAAFGALSDPERAPASVAGLLTTSMHMTLLGALLALTPRRLFFHDAACDPFLHPVHDQQLGGAIMIVIGGGAYLAGGLFLIARLLWRAPRAESAGSRPR